MSRSADPGDLLATLLIVAKQDSAFRRQVLALLRVPAPHREPMINTAVHEMRLRGESAAACAAIGALGTDDGAKIALSILNE